MTAEFERTASTPLTAMTVSRQKSKVVLYFLWPDRHAATGGVGDAVVMLVSSLLLARQDLEKGEICAVTGARREGRRRKRREGVMGREGRKGLILVRGTSIDRHLMILKC